jgi:radical SAM superfamily enzyme YgiQ (UPF0313 family)
MKQISLVQVNFQQGPKELNAHYLPYSVGVIWSYANQFDSIKQAYTLAHILWRRESIDSAVSKLADQDVVAFSCYVWNRNYNYTLAKRLKEVNPNCCIIFGGPEPAITDPDIFVKHPYVDAIVKQEGEYIFKNVLDSIDNLASVTGLLLNVDGQAVDTGTSNRIENLDSIPSPYLTGFFDKIVADNPDVEWNATLETNRGCPYACTFCDWGSLTYNKVKKFNLERVFAELEWMAKHKCGFLSVTDANFGMFVERDNLIIDRFIEIQNKHGYPYTFNVSWAKNQKKDVVDIVSKLMTTKAFNHGLTLSFQSLDDTVLENIKRKNLTDTNVSEIFKLAEANQVPINSELILGLPGETLDTWKENFWKLFRAGNHSGIDIFQAQLLENAEMNHFQKSLYKIKSITVYDYMSGSHNDNELQESVDVITETSTLSFDQMVEAQVFNWFINSFHINGLTNYISRFMYKHSGIDYKDFYEDLFEFIKRDSWLNNEIEEFTEYTTRWMKDGKIDHPRVANIDIHGWNLIYRTNINIHAQNMKDHVMFVLTRFLNRYNLDQSIKTDLIKLQSQYIITYPGLQSYPKTVKLKHDIYNYVVNDSELNQSSTVLIEFPENANMSFEKFLELLYYSRRRNFGKGRISVL